jgi:hypothetical protein
MGEAKRQYWLELQLPDKTALVGIGGSIVLDLWTLFMAPVMGFWSRPRS